MKLPRRVVLVGAIATAAPGPDADLHEVITATVACSGADGARGDAEPSGFFVDLSWHSGQAGQNYRRFSKDKNLRTRASQQLISF